MLGRSTIMSVVIVLSATCEPILTSVPLMFSAKETKKIKSVSMELADD